MLLVRDAYVYLNSRVGRVYHLGSRTYLFDIDFWHLKEEGKEKEWENKYCVDAFHAGNVRVLHCFDCSVY